jgi:hypothetical protein
VPWRCVRSLPLEPCRQPFVLLGRAATCWLQATRMDPHGSAWACFGMQVLVIAGGATLTCRQVACMVKQARREQQQLISETFVNSDAAGQGEKNTAGGGAPSTSGRDSSKGAGAAPRVAVNIQFLQRLLRILSM